MKRKGYTLIEVIVVLGLLSVCLLVIAPGVGACEEKRLAREMEYAVDGIVEFINGCKSYARNHSDKSLKIKQEERKVKLYQNTNLVNEFTLPESVNIQITAYSKVWIGIDKSGHIKIATTINLYNSAGSRKDVTIQVGTRYVSEKK
ncbi:prepilin-type N-terminal cleavage/methylation domain-containing protein [Clostridium sp.]|uniref:type II secretion system protein n=1 Tax=Clostridium sp. TaxID=1506 RepID=UPI003217770F